MPHCSRQLRDRYVAPRLRGSTHYFHFGCPFVTEAVDAIYGFNAFMCLASRGVLQEEA